MKLNIENNHWIKNSKKKDIWVGQIYENQYLNTLIQVATEQDRSGKIKHHLKHRRRIAKTKDQIDIQSNKTFGKPDLWA